MVFKRNITDFPKACLLVSFVLGGEEKTVNCTYFYVNVDLKNL